MEKVTARRSIKWLEFYFKKYGMDKITAVVRKTNHISKHVHAKLGFVDNGEKIIVIRGEPVDFWCLYINNFIEK